MLSDFIQKAPHGRATLQDKCIIFKRFKRNVYFSMNTSPIVGYLSYKA